MNIEKLPNIKMFKKTLYYTGNIDILNKRKMAVVGRRHCSIKAGNIVNDIVHQLVSKDIAIVSGGANGIDMHAHFNAVNNNGCTIIVAAEGILRYRIPQILKPAYDDNRVLILSEFHPSSTWCVNYAMTRNKTVIDLSESVIAVETNESGGTYNTCCRCIKSGKKLYIPYIKDCTGNMKMIKMGAKPIYKNNANGRANIEKILVKEKALF